MIRGKSGLLVAVLVAALLPGTASAVTRDVADLQTVRFAYPQSVLNQLTYDTYRDPYDELQSRPWNLLFNNIGRHPTLGPWPGQEGSYTRYLNALIGNNGAANVDNNADAIQGSMIRRETPRIAWGISGAYLAGLNGNDDVAGTASFSGNDDLQGLEARGAFAVRILSGTVLGGGLRLTNGRSELADRSFETGVGGFSSIEDFDQSGVAVDVGMRQFVGTVSSFDVRLLMNNSTSNHQDMSEDLDAAGDVTGLFAVTNYEIVDTGIGVSAGYNRLMRAGLGEMEFRAGVERQSRELDNADLAYGEVAGVVTPSVTLLEQDPVNTQRVALSAKSIFQAGETEMFAGAQLFLGNTTGSTQVDAEGLIVNEEIDDSETHLGLTIGLRQPLLRDKLRFIVSGRADVINGERATTFDTGSESEDSSLSTARYAIGLEAVLANVTFDLAWLAGDEGTVVPPELGLPTGSRRTVDLNRLVFSAAVAW